MKKTLAFFCLILFAGCSSGKIPSDGTIYKSPENKNEVFEFYDSRLDRWPVPFEEIDVPTRYGKVNLIASGDENAPPIFLFHPMGVTATVWRENVESLSGEYRVFCVGTIGDIGKSELYDLDFYPRNGRDYAAWFAEILDSLGYEKCYVIGGSMGGWISMNCAAELPERVEKLVLLGPMGLKANTFKAMRKLSKLLMNPSDKNKRELTAWVLGDDETVNKEVVPLINAAMNCEGRMPIPKKIPQKTLRKIDAKTLLILGDNDNPIGDPERNVKYAGKNFPDIRFEVLESGHLISLEKADEVNEMILDFFDVN